MAKYLYRLGQWSVNKRKGVLFSTLAILIVLGIATLSLGSAFSKELTIPNTPADRAGKVISEEFAGAANLSSKIQIVFKAPDDKTMESADVEQAITAMLNDIGTDAGVAGVATPVQLQNISPSKQFGYAEVTFKVAAEEVAEETKEHILSQMEHTREAGIQTEARGDVVLSESETPLVEVIGIIVAFFILAITFASFVAAGLPILTAGAGLGVGMLLIVIGSNFIEIQNVSLSLAAMIGLAVGIDYALFIMTRFKQQLAQGYSVPESVAIANGTAGSAVVFAGVTVVIGLLGLSVANIPFLSMMGYSAALCVVTTVIISVVVLPAVLGMIGHKLTPAKENKWLGSLTGTNKNKKKKASSNRWGEFVTKRPLVVSLVSIALLAVIAVPFFHINLGLPSDGTAKSTDTTERRAYDLLTEGYGEGFNASLIVAAKADKPTEGTPQAVAEIAKEISALPGVLNVTPAFPGPSGQLYVMTVIPQTGPDDTQTKSLVKAIRALSDETVEANQIELMVTGTTAMNIDIAQKLNDALPIFAALIVVMAYLLLVLVFRSLLIPLKAVLGFLLSLGATLGFVVFVVQDGNLLGLFGFPASSPILAFLPVILIGILFGLAMDYEIFLVSKMREVYAHTGDPRRAILDGVRDSGRVVIAAGLIMISVFVGFMLAPDAMIKSIGMALAVGVLFDAFIVRLTIVPAVMSLMGKAAWYMPKWLDKLLPNIDVEGESIMKEVEKKTKVA
ncbi:MMPL family transporter [Paenibacillus kobensis]|uniref:MMPL family transporter n=1 Tax=Paenibacillus kobensis TaxID=59841 RepID=UPI000FD7D80F|nr:MMPL family transporter [Paenibacillus kobensis]